MRTLLLSIALALLGLMTAAAPAAAKSAGKSVDMMPGVTENKVPSGAYLSVVIGRLGSETRSDNIRSEGARNSGWTYGLNFRGEGVPLDTRYGGSFGGTFDLDVFVVTPGAISGPQEPNFSYLYMGFTPALALGVFRTKSTALTVELGAPLNTDFYGLSAGFYSQLSWFYLGYRMRTGMGWAGQEFLDERIRIGAAGISSSGLASFFGLEIIDGYGEDSQGRANLASLMRGSYTMVSLVMGAGR